MREHKKGPLLPSAARQRMFASWPLVAALGIGCATSAARFDEAPTTFSVVYLVDGTAKNVRIGYMLSPTETLYVNDAKLPWALTFAIQSTRTFTPTVFALAAQGKGALTCELAIDGVRKSTKTVEAGHNAVCQADRLY